jgi:hypothetical protein
MGQGQVVVDSGGTDGTLAALHTSQRARLQQSFRWKAVALRN